MDRTAWGFTDQSQLASLVVALLNGSHKVDTDLQNM